VKAAMPNIKRSILNRILFSFGCVVVFSGLVIWNIFNIQVVNGEKWRSLSDSLTLKYKVIQAVRGNIYGDDGTLLATSVPRYELRMDMTVLVDDTFRKYIPQLATLFSQKFKDKSSVDYLLAFKEAKINRKRYFFLKKKLSFLDVKEIKGWPLFKKGRYKSGLMIEEENFRVMPFKNMLTRTIGYASTSKDKQRVGIEGSFDKELAGSTGRRLVQRISGGYRPVNDNNELEPLNGKDIYTTINVNMQDVLNNALLNGLIKHKAHHGCAVLMEVKTGEVKAIANLTLTENGSYQEVINYAVGEAYEPGSTFKLVSALAMLEKEKISLEDSVLINYGEYQIGKRVMRDAERSPFRSKSFEYSFEHSSNVGISTSMMNAFKSNPKEFTDYIKELKINKPLGVEIPGETSPKIAEPGTKSWSPVSLPWMSIGYEVTLTPMQLLTIYNGVANDGEMMKPFFVKAIGQKGEIEKRYKPITIHEEMASKSTLKKVRALLKGVVDSGTAKNISNSRIEIAGKTGTARISDGKAYSEGDYNSSFAGYFPADKPLYSIIVVINRPREGGYFGGVVAGPIVKEIAEKILGTQQHTGSELSDSLKDSGTLPFVIAGKKSKASRFLNNFTDYDFEGDADNSDWITARKDSVTNYTYNLLSENQNVIPNLKGMGLRDALYYLENRKIKVTYSGKGSVYWQSVEPGSKIIKGSSIYLKLKTGW